MERKITIRDLFSPGKNHFKIPRYQRAYSWDVAEDKSGQVPQFLEDLIEQPENISCHFGHFLFEKDHHNPSRHYIIDGQQRLTTVVIFFSCLIKVFQEREMKEIIFAIKEDYIQNGKDGFKFQTVDYDNNFFENEIIYDKPDEPTTKSSKRIREAKEFFLNIMRQTATEELIRWKELVEGASVTTDVVQRRTEAAQLFAFKNDRGKGLTELEKLKAFLMFNIFLASKENDEEPEELTQFIQEEFKTIYLELDKITSLNEDQILSAHCVAFISTSGNVLEIIKKALPKENNKIFWIKDLVTSVKMTFLKIRKIEELALTDSAVGDLLMLDACNSLPLLIKLFYYHSETLNELEYLFELMEITLFRLQYTTGNYRTNKFHIYAYDYDGKSLESLRNQLFESADKGFQAWWNFRLDFENCLKRNHNYWNSKLSSLEV